MMAVRIPLSYDPKRNLERFTRIVRVSALAFMLISPGLLTHTLSAQVNTEQLRRSDSTTGVFFQAGTSLGLARGNSEYVSMDGDARIDLVREGNNHFIVGSYRFKESQEGKISNKGFLHVRSMWKTGDVITLEGFGQVEFNEFLSLNNRNLLGCGVRMHAIKWKNAAGMAVLNMYLGVGGMFEHELYIISNGSVRNDGFRSTNYLTISWRPQDGTSASIIAYLQPLLNDLDDVRMTTDASVEFRLFAHLFFNISVSYRYHSRPMIDVERYDLELTNGIRVTLP
jgi:hypothetical protein